MWLLLVSYLVFPSGPVVKSLICEFIQTLVPWQKVKGLDNLLSRSYKGLGTQSGLETNLSSISNSLGPPVTCFFPQADPFSTPQPRYWNCSLFNLLANLGIGLTSASSNQKDSFCRNHFVSQGQRQLHFPASFPEVCQNDIWPRPWSLPALVPEKSWT